MGLHLTTWWTWNCKISPSYANTLSLSSSTWRRRITQLCCTVFLEPIIGGILRVDCRCFSGTSSRTIVSAPVSGMFYISWRKWSATRIGFKYDVPDRNQRNSKRCKDICVDDIAIYYSSRNIVTIHRRLRDAVNRLSRWALENGFSFSPVKTQCVHFTRMRDLHPHPSIISNNSSLPFVPRGKFLGLTLDSKLTLEPHLKWLRLKCELSQNVLRILSGRSWGPDWTVMFRLSLSLVQSKVDCGSFVYGFAQESELSITEPVHNTDMCLATGAWQFLCGIRRASSVPTDEHSAV